MDAFHPFLGKPREAVSVVDPEDVKAAWKLYQDVENRHPGELVGMSSTLFEQACKPGANISAVGYRAAFLRVLTSHAQELLASWLKDGHLDSFSQICE